MPSDESTNGPEPPNHPTGRPTRRRDRRTLFLIIGGAAAVVWLLDQVTKAIAVARLTDQPSVELLGGLLKLTLVYNRGAAFGLATGYTLVLSVLALGVVACVIALARKIDSLPWAVAFGLLLGGAVGNLTDRMTRPPGPLRGHVVDFLELPYWPVFNVADMAVVAAAILIVGLSLTGRHLDGTHDGGRAEARAETRGDADGQPSENDRTGDRP